MVEKHGLGGSSQGPGLGRTDVNETRTRGGGGGGGMMGQMGVGAPPGGGATHVPSLLRPLTGAFSGWDYNDDLGGSMGAGTGAGAVHQGGPVDESSMAALCERRLFFELSSLPRPEEVVDDPLCFPINTPYTLYFPINTPSDLSTTHPLISQQHNLLKYQ